MATSFVIADDKGLLTKKFLYSFLQPCGGRRRVDVKERIMAYIHKRPVSCQRCSIADWHFLSIVVYSEVGDDWGAVCDWAGGANIFGKICRIKNNFVYTFYLFYFQKNL